MSKIMEGQIDIALGDKTITLSQTLDAATKVDRQFGTLGEAVRAVIGLNIDAMSFVIAAGSGRQVDTELLDSVWRHRVDIAENLLKYLMIMRNGGNPASEGSNEGNALG